MSEARPIIEIAASAPDIHWNDSILDETSRNSIARFGFIHEDAAHASNCQV